MSSTKESSDSFLVVVDMPTGVEFGIDCITYETGPKFKGLSLVPSGLHFVYHGSGMGARQGFFVDVGNNDLIVRCWDSSQEEILPTQTLSEESVQSLQRAILSGELNSNLGPYPLQQHHVWKNNTNFITYGVLERADCTPGCLLFPGDDSDMLVIDKKSKHASHDVSLAVKPYFPDSARVARFTDIQMLEMAMVESIPSSDQKAGLITAMMMDKSALIEHMIAHAYNGYWAGLLGELQLSFMMFMLLYSYPALKQWKLMVYTICSSERYLHSNLPFCYAFMKILFSQLNFAPADFFENELSTDNFLRPVITSLFSSLTRPNLDPTLVEHKQRLRTFLQKRFNLHETDVFPESRGGGAGEGMENGEQVFYDESDFYNVAEEDMPTFVSSDEIQSFYARGSGAIQSSTGGSSDNSKAVLDRSDMQQQDALLNDQLAGAMSIGDDSDISGQQHKGLFLVRELHGKGQSQGHGFTFSTDNADSNAATTSGVASTTAATASAGGAFEARWASIDSALGVTPATASTTAHASLSSSGGAANTVPAAGASAVNNPVPQRERTTYVPAFHAASSSSATSATSSPVPSAPLVPPAAAMSPAEKEAGLYSWRYPLLFESMQCSGGGREDMVMAAVRILEAGPQLDAADAATKQVHVQVPTQVSSLFPVASLNSEGEEGGFSGSFSAAAAAATNAPSASDIARMRYMEAQRFLEYEIALSSH
jgi:A1 cistron-splicing factor AAR2